MACINPDTKQTIFRDRTLIALPISDLQRRLRAALPPTLVILRAKALPS